MMKCPYRWTLRWSRSDRKWWRKWPKRKKLRDCQDPWKKLPGGNVLVMLSRTIGSQLDEEIVLRGAADPALLFGR
jgi:hypothetical protein